MHVFFYTEKYVYVDVVYAAILCRLKLQMSIVYAICVCYSSVCECTHLTL